jgi:hypothetical protein
MLVRDSSTKKPVHTPNRWVPYHSPLLSDIAASLSRIECPIVLDLGSASAESIEYYSGFGAKVFVEDLRSDILAAGSDTNALASAVDKIAQRGPQRGCEVVMMWDLLNYLPRKQRRHLAQYVTQVMPPGSLLYVFLWTKPLMPDLPLRFDLLPGDEVLYRVEGPPSRLSPLITKPDLAKLFPEFQRVRSFLSRTGIEEQLLIKTRAPST